MTYRPNTLLIAGLIVAALVILPAAANAAGAESLATLSYLGRSDLPKGMRNNNPGNIRVSSNPWKGKVPFWENTDGSFEQFTAYVWGIRAMIRNLQSYQTQRGLDTVRQIVNTWAPAADNNPTTVYVTYVADRMGISPDARINLFDMPTMRAIVRAMAHFENGMEAVTDAQFNYAYSLL